MAVTKRSAAAKSPKKAASTNPAEPELEVRIEPAAEEPPDAAPEESARDRDDAPTEPAPDNPAGVPEIEVKVSHFRETGEAKKPPKKTARASFYLVPQTGELHNRPGPGWVELTPEQTAVAEVLPRRKRAAWWRQQRRKQAADAAGR